MNIETVEFETLLEPPIPEWIIRISVKGDGFLRRAIPLGALVGELVVEGILIDIDAKGFTGYLTDEPPQGAPVTVGYLSEEFIDTGFTYQPPA